MTIITCEDIMRALVKSVSDFKCHVKEDQKRLAGRPEADGFQNDANQYIKEAEVILEQTKMTLVTKEDKNERKVDEAARRALKCAHRMIELEERLLQLR